MPMMMPKMVCTAIKMMMMDDFIDAALITMERHKIDMDIMKSTPTQYYTAAFAAVE